MYLNYFRALTNRYEGMSQEEKEHLCALIMYEAGKRFVAGSIENVTARGYSACPSYNWLMEHGSPEGIHEAFYSIAIYSTAGSRGFRKISSGFLPKVFVGVS